MKKYLLIIWMTGFICADLSFFINCNCNCVSAYFWLEDENP